MGGIPASALPEDPTLTGEQLMWAYVGKSFCNPGKEQEGVGLPVNVYRFFGVGSQLEGQLSVSCSVALKTFSGSLFCL